MRNQPSLRERQAAVANWNRHFPPGTAVQVRKDDGITVDTKTRSEAELLGEHTPVIWVEGIAGAYALDRCKPLQTDLPLNTP